MVLFKLREQGKTTLCSKGSKRIMAVTQKILKPDLNRKKENMQLVEGIQQLSCFKMWPGQHTDLHT